ncbi:taste receptor type 2 member 4 [Oryctolagus cuniculus]|uniref:Taste receptor type 2 n=1 Tax=Oryctolagus cuniculus TaxID=9986 RepID=G1SKF6_RABIT|nr:taste receptor type 2 member 4 [Oryctolagus cuniculus]
MYLGFYFFVIAFFVLIFVGTFTSLFITVVSYKSWAKSNRNSSSDRILFSLGITRFLTLGLFLLNIIYHTVANVERSVYVSIFLLACLMFLDSVSVWFVTLLNILYCVKIANFQTSVFRLLKRNISPTTPRLLGACVLVSAFTTVLHVVLRETLPFSNFVSRRNGTMFGTSEDISSLVISSVLNSFVQLTINVTCASLLIHSLRRHIKKMQGNATGLWSPQTEAHVGAMKLMICFLVLYIPYSVTSLICFLPYVKVDLRIRCVCIILSTLYHPGHSVLIIFTHPKLKTKAKKILCFNK